MDLTQLAHEEDSECLCRSCANIRSQRAFEAKKASRLAESSSTPPQSVYKTTYYPPVRSAAMVNKPKKRKILLNPPICLCGCLGATRGGRYLPGHDTIHRAKLMGPRIPPLCLCGCGDRTRGGIYKPGHDAKHFSALKALEKAEAAAKAKAKGIFVVKPKSRRVAT